MAITSDRLTEIGIYRLHGGEWMQQSRPLLSFCLPTYQRARYLAETLESIAKQGDLSDCEVVVCDNASEDETQAVLDSFSSRLPLVVYRNERNIGSPANLLRTVSLARGRYVWLLGDDDPVVEGAWAHLRELLGQSTGVGYVFMPRHLVTGDLKELSTGGGVQPGGVEQDLWLPDGRRIFQAFEGQLVDLLGFYGCNVIRRDLWLDHAARLGIQEPDNWTHLRIILHAIRSTPCWISRHVGVWARLNPAPDVIDSRVWLDMAVAVYIEAASLGYDRDLCEDAIRRRFRHHAKLFLLDKSAGRRRDSLPELAGRLGCSRLLDPTDPWVLLSRVPGAWLYGLPWLRRLRRALRRSREVLVKPRDGQAAVQSDRGVGWTVGR